MGSAPHELRRPTPRASAGGEQGADRLVDRGPDRQDRRHGVAIACRPGAAPPAPPALRRSARPRRCCAVRPGSPPTRGRRPARTERGVARLHRVAGQHHVADTGQAQLVSARASAWMRRQLGEGRASPARRAHSRPGPCPSRSAGDGEHVLGGARQLTRRVPGCHRAEGAVQTCISASLSVASGLAMTTAVGRPRPPRRQSWGPTAPRPAPRQSSAPRR